MRNRFLLLADTGDTLVGALREELSATDYALLHVKDGQKAIEHLELLESEIDLAIIELELPIVSGLDVIWWLVRRKQMKPTRIIATSPANVPLLKRVVSELGVQAVVQGPMHSPEWRELIVGALSRRSSDAAPEGNDQDRSQTLLRELPPPLRRIPSQLNMSEKTKGARSIDWLHIVLFCEPCQMAAQVVTLAVSSDKTILLRCICPRCGNKFQDDFSMEELVALGEASGQTLKTQPPPQVAARKCH